MQGPGVGCHRQSLATHNSNSSWTPKWWVLTNHPHSIVRQGQADIVDFVK
jgi:hypothetical protein